MSHLKPVPQPPSALGYHRILSSTAGVRVSPLCLGAMNFGEAWAEFMGKCDKKTSFEILDYFYNQGGNFIDTANAYQAEQSEEWLGEWMEQRDNRSEMVIATKFTSGYRKAHADKQKLQSNFQGNSAKSLRVSLEASLKKLKTDYVDILYLHWWDFSTSIPEIMQSLNTLVAQGKVIYLGISDTPAWIVSKANQYARDHGLRQFVVYQGRWSASQRDFEREILAMVEAEGMALAPWGALGGGNFKNEEQRKNSEGRNMGGPSEKDIKVSEVLEKVAKRRDSIITSVALAYVMHKAPNVFPIVGGRKIEHLEGNIAALKLKLSQEDIDEIEAAYPFDYGFPLNFLFVGADKPTLKTGDMKLVQSNAYIDSLERQLPIRPRD